MSLILNDPKSRDHVDVKTFPECMFPGVRFGEYRVSLSDFLEAAMYVLTNTDLVKDDPRLEFVENVRRLEQVLGWQSSINESTDRGDRRLAIKDDAPRATKPSDYQPRNPTVSPAKNPTESPVSKPSDAQVAKPSDLTAKNPTVSPAKKPTKKAAKKPPVKSRRRHSADSHVRCPVCAPLRCVRAR